MYTPDRWVIITFDGSGVKERIFKVFASWGGSYTTGQSWRMNSGITKIVDHDTYYSVEGHSGSVYNCRKDCVGTFAYTDSVLGSYVAQSNDKISVRICPIEEAIEFLKKE